MQDKREAAAKALVEELLQNQEEFEADRSEEDEEDGEEEGAENGSGGSKRVEAALRRCSPLMVGG